MSGNDAVRAPTIEELSKRLDATDPVFDAWRKSIPAKHWANRDLSALRIGYELGRALASQPRVDACSHTDTHGGYDVVTCKRCGYVKTDSGWGIASNRWFKSRNEAEFYRQNGRLPDKAQPRVDAGAVAWTDEQIAEFMSVALRHTEYKAATSGPTATEIRQGLARIGATPPTPSGNAALVAKLVEALEAEYVALADIRNDWPGRHSVSGQAKLCKLRDLIAEATGRDPEDVQNEACARALAQGDTNGTR